MFWDKVSGVYDLFENIYNKSKDAIDSALDSEMTYGDFFFNAPALNPNRKFIKGVICGIRVEDIEEPLMQEIRYMD